MTLCKSKDWRVSMKKGNASNPTLKKNFFSLFQMVHFLTHYADKIESVHFSDQFSGPKIMQEYVWD